MTTQAVQLPTKKGEVLVLKARALKPSEDGFSPHQYGESVNSNLEINVKLDVPALGRTYTTVLSFAPKAETYSWERLRALGKEDDDISHLRGIEKNEVDVELRGDEYNGKFMIKVQILTGGGNFGTKNPLNPKEFAAKLQAQSGKGMGNSGGGAPEAPPF